MGTRRAWQRWHRRLDRMAARTPPERDRYVDFLRVFAIGVVVLWHWALSLLQWTGERWVMPNPIHQVPGSWLATWLLQVVTVFFLVGGYANASAWWAARRDGRGVAGYLAVRLRRLLLPIAVFVAVWAGVEVLAHVLVPGYSGVLRYAPIVFTPLWFVAAYVWVVLLTPLTATAHARARWWTLGALAALVAGCDLGRFAAGVPAFGWVNTALVWVFIHQLGYFYRDRYPPRPYPSAADAGRGAAADAGRGAAADAGWGAAAAAVRSRWLPVSLVTVGLLLLAALTSLPAYPPSMVATVGQERSNILPTTATIASLSVLQLGVIMLLRAPVSRWLRRPAVWKPVVAANAVVLTVFLWHMTALLVVLAGLRAWDVELLAEPTLVWWAQRPFWVVAPAVVLALLVGLFARFEQAGRLRLAGGGPGGDRATADR